MIHTNLIITMLNFSYSHKPLLVGISGIIVLILQIIFIYNFLQLGKEENRLPEKHSKIVINLICSGIAMFLFGAVVVLTGSTYLALY